MELKCSSRVCLAMSGLICGRNWGVIKLIEENKVEADPGHSGIVGNQQSAQHEQAMQVRICQER